MKKYEEILDKELSIVNNIALECLLLNGRERMKDDSVYNELIESTKDSKLNGNIFSQDLLLRAIDVARKMADLPTSELREFVYNDVEFIKTQEETNSLEDYHRINAKNIPQLEEFIIYRDIEDCLREKGIEISEDEKIDLKEIILDFYNEDSKENFPLTFSTRFITNNYLDKNISMEELRNSSFYDLYDAIDNDDIKSLCDTPVEERINVTSKKDRER